MNEKHETEKVTRRFFVSACSALAGGVALSVWGCQRYEQTGLDGTKPGPYPLAEAENIIHTTCLQCNTQCTLKVKLQEGLVAKIDGNPYGADTLYPHLPYETPPREAVAVDAAICPKGQAGVQTLYDPYRVRRVLKRAGARGSNKWRAISFEQAIQEISEGGQLFADVGEKRVVPGFKEVVRLRDAKLAKALAADVEAIRKGAFDYITKPLDIERFQQRLADWLADAQMRRRTLALDSELVRAFQLEGIIGRSPAILEVFSKIRRIAPHFQTALITGETGTG